MEPTERYSAIPSMNQSGMREAAGTSRPTEFGPRPVRSNWKAWTSSWPMTWSVSDSDPPIGSTIRRFRNSVSPPVDSPIWPGTALVCSKSGWFA